MAEQRLLDLVASLKGLTDKNKVDWQETPEEGVFQAAFPEYTIKIRQANDPYHYDNAIVVQIYNANGAQIESASDRELEQLAPNTQGLHEFMGDLFQAARRKALGTEKAVSDLLSYLQTLSAS